MRIGIVNDLPLAREVLRRLVLSVPGYQVAWTAADGAEAVARARQDRPDVILMDLVMPVMDGVEATRRIMAECPCPILLVTAFLTSNHQQVMAAMSHGCLDAVGMPVQGPDGGVRGGERLLERLARLGRADRPTALRLPCPAAAASPRADTPPLLALGASTGGPEALARVVEALPATFPAPVVIVQHIAPEFAPLFVGWLQGRSALPVETAREGVRPASGRVLVAATDDHLVMRPDGRLAYSREPIDYPFRPSVNVLFESLACHWGAAGVAVLLTGMGSDGAAGLAALRRAGWLTIAQDQESCVVYGMPRAAAELRAACRVLPLAEIPAAVLAHLRK